MGSGHCLWLREQEWSRLAMDQKVGIAAKLIVCSFVNLDTEACGFDSCWRLVCSLVLLCILPLYFCLLTLVCVPFCFVTSFPSLPQSNPELLLWALYLVSSSLFPRGASNYCCASFISIGFCLWVKFFPSVYSSLMGGMHNEKLDQVRRSYSFLSAAYRLLSIEMKSKCLETFF